VIKTVGFRFLAEYDKAEDFRLMGSNPPSYSFDVAMF